jgi:hypothetical protein
VDSTQQILIRCDNKHGEIAALVQAMAALLGRAQAWSDEPEDSRFLSASGPQRVSFEVEYMVSTVTTLAAHAKDVCTEIGELLPLARETFDNPRRGMSENQCTLLERTTANSRIQLRQTVRTIERLMGCARGILADAPDSTPAVLPVSSRLYGVADLMGPGWPRT